MKPTTESLSAIANLKRDHPLEVGDLVYINPLCMYRSQGVRDGRYIVGEVIELQPCGPASHWNIEVKWPSGGTAYYQYNKEYKNLIPLVLVDAACINGFTE